MPPHSRRALLAMLGCGSAALLSGCQTDLGVQTTTRRTMTTTQTETTTKTTDSQTETETTTETPAEVDCATVSRPESAWPVPRRSPAQDSYVADAQGFEDAPAVGWEVEPSVHDEEYATPSYGQPVVDGESVYVTNELNKGPQRPMYGHVHALAVESGDRRWTSGKLRSPSVPAVWGDRVVSVAENESLGAMVIAFDPMDGQQRWTREFEARDSGFVTADDLLYLALEEGTSLGTVRALAADGATVWSRESALADHVTVGPVVGTETVYVATRKGRLHALSRDNGSTDWSHQFEHPTEPRPYITNLVATDCAVFTVVEGAVTALDDDGIVAWQVEGDHASLATDGDLVYTTIGRGGDRELLALEAASGEVRWTFEAPVRSDPPILAGEDIYVRTDDSIVALTDQGDTERWRRVGDLADRALADGTLYGTTDGNLIALQ